MGSSEGENAPLGVHFDEILLTWLIIARLTVAAAVAITVILIYGTRKPRKAGKTKT